MSIFAAAIAFIIIQRLAELSISLRNINRLIAEGGIEYGAEHYKYIVAIHTMFILSMIFEYLMRSRAGNLAHISYLFLIFFAVLQLMRYWVITSLGKFWNTRIIRIPGAALVAKGPYKYIKHPNYLIVACEIFCLPMAFGLYYTAILFTVLNAFIMTVRIKEENKALNT